MMISLSLPLAVVHEHVRQGNHALDSGDIPQATSDGQAVRAMVARSWDSILWPTNGRRREAPQYLLLWIR